ncbi:LpqB family beta-propeller domain-containing protein [Rugosimonospora africana]|uniref:LpqB family beta-propeller domain-containing protein n=1 Tax=Rugosimonospora africana TaxID=556532 RepID=UPI001941F0DE|nr:LpqB family beta-propeller domain-containing protein [Rugosimonospora africana]
MVDRRQVLRVIALGGAALAVPAACGLPSGGRPIVDGPAPTAGPGGSGSDLKAPVAEDATDPGALVKNFLGAVAGKLDVETDFGKANARAKAFLTAKAQRTWPSASQVTVVRVVDGPTSSAGLAGETFVDVTLQPVGQLSSGFVDPSSIPMPPPTVGLRFTVVLNEQAPGSYLIDEIAPRTANAFPLTGMLLDSGGLDGQWYQPQLVYFWSTDNARKGLVPDLRYVPMVGLTRESQRTEIVNWILGGPSNLLGNAVANNLYAGISLLGPSLVAPDSNGLLINLSAAPQGLTSQQVMDQLRWSLRPTFYEGPVRLQENSQNVKADGSSDMYLKSNLADEPYRKGDETAYCVVGGVVREVTDPDQLPQALTNVNRDNRNVRYAALSGDHPYAALVKTDNHLYVGGVYRDNTEPVFVRSELEGTAWTRPVFLPADDPVVMVAVDGRLYRVDLQGKKTEVSVIESPVTAFSVAPDGHRIAVIAGGSAWVCALRVDGQDISAGPPRYIASGLSGLTGIAWSRLDRVLIAGRGTTANYQLAQATIDGAVAETWPVAFSYKITQVVALPRLPSTDSNVPRAMVQTDHNIAYYVSSSHFDPMKLKNPGGSPSPTASAGHAPATEPAPSNPFYLD